VKASLNRAKGLNRGKNGYCELKLVSESRVKFTEMYCNTFQKFSAISVSNFSSQSLLLLLFRPVSGVK